MLTWDDEVTPTPSKPVSSGLNTNREASHAPLAPQGSIPQPAILTLHAGANAPAAIAPIATQPAPRQASSAQTTSQRRFAQPA